MTLGESESAEVPSPKSKWYLSGIDHVSVTSALIVTGTNACAPVLSRETNDGVLVNSVAPRSTNPLPSASPVLATFGSSTRGLPEMSVVSSPGALASPESMDGDPSAGTPVMAPL